MSNEASITIPKDLLQPAISAQVSKAMIEALGSEGKLLLALADRIMTQKVDESGKPSSYSSSKSYIEWLVENMTKDAIKEAIGEHGAAFCANVKATVEKELKKPGSKLSKAIAESAAQAAISGMSNRYGLEIRFVSSSP